MTRLRAAVDAVLAHQWSHSRDAMDALTRLVDEANRIADLLDGADILETNQRTDGRRQWVDTGTWLYPGDAVVLIEDWRTDRSEVAQSAEQRAHKPQGAGSSPALATKQEQET